MISGCFASEPFFVLVGLWQLLSTVLLLFGWFWAQFTSILLTSKAWSPPEQATSIDKNPLLEGQDEEGRMERSKILITYNSVEVP
jgi:hypothetical protein